MEKKAYRMCDCCGISKIKGENFECPICGWKDDYAQSCDNKRRGLSNTDSLYEHKKAFFNDYYASDLRYYDNNEIIIRENTVFTHIYKVISGKVFLYKDYGKESEYVIGAVASGNYFGSASFLNNEKSLYTVVSYGTTEIMRVSHEGFEKFVERNPSSAVEVMKQIALENKLLQKHVDMLIDEVNDLQATVSKRVVITDREPKKPADKYDIIADFFNT